MRGPTKRHNADDEFMRKALEWRGVETPCPRCHGAGGVHYGSGATWRGGMGPASITWGVCDQCWGSGDANNPWVDLRKQRDEFNAAVAEAAGKLLSAQLGLSMESLHHPAELLAQELDKQARRRKPPTGTDFWGMRHWEIMCNGLARLLRDTIASHKDPSSQ